MARLIHMNLARRKKLEAQLAETESELSALLLSSLPHTAMHGDMLFCNSRFHPKGVCPHWLDARSESLIALADEAMEIRARLGMSAVNSPAQWYISACEEAVDTRNPHRRGPRQLAAWLLGMLEPMRPS